MIYLICRTCLIQTCVTQTIRHTHNNKRNEKNKKKQEKTENEKVETNDVLRKIYTCI